MSPAQRGTFLLLTGLFALGAGLYLQAAGGPVLSSERPSVEMLEAIDPGAALAFQQAPDQARPLANLMRYMLLEATGSPASLRAASALLHGLNAVLVFLLAATLIRRPGREGEVTVLAPAGAALIFAVHPVASEAVLSHIALDGLLATALSLGCLLAAAAPARREGGAFLPAALYLAALLCHGGFWPVALVAAALAASRGGEGQEPSPPAPGRWLGRLAPYGVSLALFYICWAARTWPEFSFGPTQRAWPVVQGLASQAAALVDGLRLLILPVGLSLDQGRPAYLGDWNLQAVAGALLLAVLLAAAFTVGRRRGLLGVALGWLGFLHLHLVLAPPADPLQERRLYPLLVSVALLAGLALLTIERRAGSRAGAVVAALLCVPMALGAAGRARLWMNPVGLWESATRANPASARSFVALGNIHLERDETEEALQAFEGALARAPRNAVIQNSIAEVYFARGEYLQAIREADKARQFDPKYLPAYLTAGNSYMMRGQSRDAFLIFNEALRVSPDDPSALYNMGVLHYQERQYIKAARLLERAAELRPEDPEIHFRLGLSRFYQGNYAGAAEALQACLLLEPHRLDARVNLAAVQTKLGQHDAATAILQSVLEEEPDNAEALNGMAILASARNDTQGARAYFEQAVEADPENLQFLFNLASAYEEQGEYELAVGAYQEFLDRWTGSLDLGERVRERLEILRARLASQRDAS